MGRASLYFSSMFPFSTLVALWLCAVGLTSSAVRAFSIPFKKALVSKASDSIDPFTFGTINDLEIGTIYAGTVTILGQEFEVQLDTGSSDLWLDTSNVDISSLIQSGQSSSLTYGDNTVAEGPIVIGNVTFGDFTFSQALISAPGSNATALGDKGLLGLGLPLNSRVRSVLQNTSLNGDTVLENIFATNPSLPTYITFQLARSETTGSTDGGAFTIGELDSNFSAILDAPKMNVASPGAWEVLMDGMIINGQLMGGGSANPQLQGTNQTTAILDTGTSGAAIPKSYIDAIYGSVPGAYFNETASDYVVPCDAKLNVSFVFGGIAYPIHPIDLISATTRVTGDILCYPAFQQGSPTFGTDFLLGDSFLRNVYSLYAFGPELSFVNGPPAAYVQILSTTNLDQAFVEFDQLSAQRNASLLRAKTPNGGSANGNNDGKQNGASSMTLNSRMAITGTAMLSVGLIMFIA